MTVRKSGEGASMQVRLAEHHGMCFGVRDAIGLGRLRDRFGDGAGARLGVAAQTTQPVERVRELVEAVKRSLPLAEVRYVDTVCQPTKDRQESLRRLATESDVVVVV